MNNLSIKSGCYLMIAGILTSIMFDLPSFQRNSNLAVAQPAKTSTKPVARRRAFPIPEGAAKIGYFGRSVGASSRGDKMAQCSIPDKNLTAIVPAYEIDKAELDKVVIGLTSSKNPTLWVYNPYQGNSIASATLKLSTRDGSVENQVHQQQINLPQKPGFVAVDLPKNSTLEIDRPYKWKLELAIKCPKYEKTFVSGWILRKNVDAGLKQKLAAASAKEQAALYVDNNFWYDALNILAQLRRDRPQDPAIEREWKELLTNIDELGGELAGESVAIK